MSLAHPFAPEPTAAHFAMLYRALRATEQATVAVMADYRPGEEPRQRALDNFISVHRETMHMVEAMLSAWYPIGKAN